MVDNYGRTISYLRLSVTDLCNLRCRYCMPEIGVCKKRHEDMLTEDEMVTAVTAAAQLGIRKLRITGGEPLVKKNILSICRRTAAVPGIDEVCQITRQMQDSMERALRQARAQQVKNKPSENVSKSIGLLMDVDPRLFEKLSEEEKETLKADLSELEQILKSFRKQLEK